MGVQNLLPLVSPVSKTVSLSSFKGKKVAIDGYVWLHRCSYKCARDMVMDPYTDVFLPHVMSKINSLMSAGVIPVIVFDGQN